MIIVVTEKGEKMRDKMFDKLVEAAAERVILAIQSGVIGVCYRCGENNLLERVGKLEKKVARCIPTAEPKTGRWIPQDWNDKSGTCTTLVYCLPKCSVCGYSAIQTNYCPNCGAKMEGEADG